jgi:3-oxoacyl-(acyl-carrier-protein) synthase
MAYERIKSGQANRMLAGSTSDSGPYIWGGFDVLRVCTLNTMKAQSKVQDL